jgi:hypothetical protein
MMRAFLDAGQLSQDYIAAVNHHRGTADSALRCTHCGAPLIETSAYPKRGRRLACLAGNAAGPGHPGAFPCGALR